MVEAYAYSNIAAKCICVKTDGSVYYNGNTYNKAFSGDVIVATGGDDASPDLVIKAKVACKINGGYYGSGGYVSLSGDYNANATIFNLSILPNLSIIAIKK